MLFILMVPAIYLLAPLLTVIAIASLGCSFVMLNSFLPLLSSNHPSVRAQEKDAASFISPTAPAISPSPADAIMDPTLSATPTPSRPAPALTFSNAMSARGVGLGYAAAVLVQVLCILTLMIVSKHTSSRTLPLRIALFLAATWWFIFTIPTYLWLRPRPGPPLPASLTTTLSPTHTPSRLRVATTYLFFAWTSIWRTLRMALSLSQLRLFLIAWFLMSDAIATVVSRPSLTLILLPSHLHPSAHTRSPTLPPN
jgi:MFS transporter, UMF1 family